MSIFKSLFGESSEPASFYLKGKKISDGKLQETFESLCFLSMEDCRDHMYKRFPIELADYIKENNFRLEILLLARQYVICYRIFSMRLSNKTEALSRLRELVVSAVKSPDFSSDLNEEQCDVFRSQFLSYLNEPLLEKPLAPKPDNGYEMRHYLPMNMFIDDFFTWFELNDSSEDALSRLRMIMMVIFDMNLSWLDNDVLPNLKFEWS
ncbi:hypothetical protein J7I06_002214 [Vibrio vulnificus]|uniref:hypothetical protein n=1 Tax=Vibrio vulnificus TaxID=672 RepID=UPI000CD1C434|nr:hypothetical protein [Vibrio vulnificus]EHH0802865.1 hypothetical protein [Vibrio vulnificus]POC21632.1 hypothetical protein CRN42_10805 [Vibrio vulnificus]